jgi:hypothetical protein
MTTNNLALYRALVKLGVAEDVAETAAVMDTSALATKADLAVAVAELRSDLLKWGVGILLTGLTLQTALILFAIARSH